MRRTVECQDLRLSMDLCVPHNDHNMLSASCSLCSGLLARRLVIFTLLTCATVMAILLFFSAHHTFIGGSQQVSPGADLQLRDTQATRTYTAKVRYIPKRGSSTSGANNISSIRSWATIAAGSGAEAGLAATRQGANLLAKRVKESMAKRSTPADPVTQAISEHPRCIHWLQQLLSLGVEMGTNHFSLSS